MVVVVEVEGGGESLSLGVVGVGLHVAMEVARLREPEIAHLAAVRLLSTVYPLVLGERGPVGKGLPAVVAPVGPLPRVGPNVGGHRETLREPLLAEGSPLCVRRCVVRFQAWVNAFPQISQWYGFSRCVYGGVW